MRHDNLLCWLGKGWIGLALFFCLFFLEESRRLPLHPHFASLSTVVRITRRQADHYIYFKTTFKTKIALSTKKPSHPARQRRRTCLHGAGIPSPSPRCPVIYFCSVRHQIAFVSLADTIPSIHCFLYLCCIFFLVRISYLLPFFSSFPPFWFPFDSGSSLFHFTAPHSSVLPFAGRATLTNDRCYLLTPILFPSAYTTWRPLNREVRLNVIPHAHTHTLDHQNNLLFAEKDKMTHTCFQQHEAA